LAKICLVTGEKKKLNNLINRLEEQRDLSEHQYHLRSQGEIEIVALPVMQGG